MNIFKTLFGFKKLADASTPARNYYDRALHEITGTDSIQLLSEYTRDYSGYVRQAALKRCVELARPELLPVVADRLNDWVPQVRHAARTALITLLPFVPAPELLAVLPVILRLHSAGRDDYAEWLEKFEQILLQMVTVGDICEAARSQDIKTARAAVHVLDKYALLDLPTLIALILQRRDDIILALRGVALCEKLTLAEQQAGYRLAACSHFGAVRTVAIRALLHLPNVADQDIAVAALLDPQSSVRSIAVHHLTATGVDVSSHYRNVLMQPGANAKRLQVSLSMLAALRDSASLPLIKSFAHHAHATVRAAALLAWFKLVEQDKDAILMEAIQQASPRVLKCAAQLVARHGAYIPLPALLQQLAVSEDVVPLMRLAATNRWNMLECVARVCLQRGVDEARRLKLDSLLAQAFYSNQWYGISDQQQRQFLLSEPVMAALGQLLPPQQLAFLREQLLF
jgi:HEAT repeat protein